jgi:hypothetical protein
VGAGATDDFSLSYEENEDKGRFMGRS